MPACSKEGLPVTCAKDYSYLKATIGSTHCAARRDVASREHNEREQDCDTCECRRVGRFHLEKQTGQQVSQRQRSCNPGGDAEDGDFRSIFHNEPLVGRGGGSLYYVCAEISFVERALPFEKARTES